MRLASAVVLAGAACAVQVDFSNTSYRCGPEMACPNGFLCFDGECRSEFPTFDAADGTPAPDAPPIPDGVADARPPLPWWDTAYLHRLPLTIVNQSTSEMVEGYQVGFFVPTTVIAASLSNLNDVRVVEWTGVDWIEQPRVDDDYDSSDPFVWFAISQPIAPAAGDAGRYWVYFGNPAAIAPTGTQVVMEMYESFPGTTLSTTRWTALNTPTVAGDELILGPTDGVRSTTSWGPGYAVDFSMEVPTWSQRFWGGFQRLADFDDSEPWLIWISRSGTMIWPEVKVTAGGVDPEVLGPASVVPAFKVLYGVERYPDHVVFRKDDLEVADIPLAASWTDPQQIRLANEASTDINFGHVRVRRVVHPAPRVSFGPVENYP